MRVNANIFPSLIPTQAFIQRPFAELLRRQIPVYQGMTKRMRIMVCFENIRAN